MRKFITQFLLNILFIVSPYVLLAQNADQFDLLLKASKFSPEENILSLDKKMPMFEKSLFSDKHYLCIQFYKIPNQEIRDRVKMMGIDLIDYIPNNTYTAAVPAGFNLEQLKMLPIRGVFYLNAFQKSGTDLLNSMVPAHAVKQAGTADLNVVCYDNISADKISDALSALGATIQENLSIYRTYVIRVPLSNIQALVSLPFVLWAEPVEAPNQTENLPGRTLHRVSILNDGVRNLKGDGINVGIWDSGEISPHVDFSPTGRVTQMEFNSAQQHSTHCAGTVLGKGILNPIARGMAPNANLYSWNYNGNVQTEQAAGIQAQNLLVSTHSYGSTGTPTCNVLTDPLLSYSTTSRNTDINLNNFPSHLHVHSSGNSGGSCSGGYLTITGSGKSAKNNLVVANLTSMDVISGSSSSGPVTDGRIKPEIAAMGTSVFSTSTPLNTYATLSGTSMATPAVAGTAALLYQRFKQLNGAVNPPSSLIKNILCNGADDLGVAGPDYRYGFGRVNALNAVKIIEDNRYVIASIAQAAVSDKIITVPAGAVRLKVMLTWNDPAATANAAPALVNDLDLSVINPASTTLPWKLNPASPATAATRGIDVISNIEQVTLDNPPAGTYTLRVNGTAITSGPLQEYALTWSVDVPTIEVIYPNGAESFNPGTAEIITWNSSGVSGTQTVEYSLNNGGSWTTIGTVAATVTRLSWTVPTTNTSQALIRVSSGSLTDQSDATFRILNTATGFNGNGNSCTAGVINFSWTANANVTHYDLLQLNTVSGDLEVLAANITGTSYSATGLNAGTAYWFSLVAKNNTTGAIAIRSNAISVTASAGGGGLSAIGSINGQTNICGAQSNVMYNVATVTGANSYTWTAPPGAVILSGQGTNNITVNYPAGSGNGNMSVFASLASGQTSTSTLAISSGSASVTAPLSGGDQVQNQCPPAPITTLTATATVSAGYTLSWYNAASGGSLVTNPLLTTVGTVTYYASSTDNSTGCASQVRTAVTLTINAAPPATVTTSGTTTFCEGGNVTLTANSGTGYTWSNGANTQSITVNTSGSYIVTVSQTGGCNLSSAPVSVTVNPLPAASISAGGPASFCEGSNVMLTASTGSSWIWKNGNTVVGTTQSIVASLAGLYTVTVTSAGGCTTTSANTEIMVSPNPTVILTAFPYSSLYPGLTTTLTAQVTPPGNYNYIWSNNGTIVPGGGNTRETGIAELGNYSVTVTNASGLACSNNSNTLRIKDSITNRLFIYPSPNHGQFQVNYYTTEVSAYTLSIFDSKGSLVFRKAYTLAMPYQKMEVDLRRYGKAVYQVLLHNTQGKKLAAGRVVVL